MSLADSDVARLQAVLDVVDGRLADPPRPQVIHPSIQRVVVLTAAALVLTLSHVAVAFVALLALLKPSAAAAGRRGARGAHGRRDSRFAITPTPRM